MRIGIDARPLTLLRTGIGRYTRELVDRMAHRAGLSLHLYSHAPIEAEFRQCRIRTGQITHPFHSSVFAQAIFPGWIKRDRLDVFWSPRHHLPLLAKTPTVVTIHDLVWRKAPDTMAPLGRLLERVLMPPSLNKAARVIAVSESTARDLVEFDPDLKQKLSVVPSGAFLSPLDQPRPPAACRPFILFVGTFEPRKNLHRLLQAFKRFTDAREFPHSLVLAGAAGWKLDIETMIRQLKLEHRVEVRPHADDTALSVLYAQCDFLVMPSLYEGFGLPLLEAMSFGKPVITSNCSSMPEVAGPAGLLVCPESVDAIYDSMRALASNRRLYQQLASAAHEQSARFSWDRAVEQTMTVLIEAAGR